MSAALQRPMSVDEFLLWEAGQDIRHEFDGFAPVAMAGGSEAHADIQRNLAIAIGGRLRGSDCRFYGSDLKVLVDESVRYPDGFVTCAPRDPRATVARDPVTIFEVVSESSARIDFHDKNREYAATPSVRRYVILSQDQVLATMFERVNDDWVGHILGRDAVIAMPEIGISVPLIEFYDGVAFETPAPAA